jgi:hypothetical protein
MRSFRALEAVEKLPRLSVLSTRKGIPELGNRRKIRG